MLGTIVNVSTILAGTLVGGFFGKKIKEEYKDAMFNAVGLAAAGLGISTLCSNLPKSTYPVLFIVSLALGGLLGSVLDIDKRFNSLVTKFGKSDLSRGLSTAILLFCIGTLSILGPVKSAVEGDNTFLFTNATLDFVTSAVLASTYGFGIAIAAGVLFLWQGSIWLLASFLGPFIPEALMTEISIVGGVLIACSGLSILNIKSFKTMNMLPSLIVPILWFGIMALIGLFTA
ncbi:MAG: DUF554 domain-containing protein [Clostridia bacterium]|nr:DUF554 domain-containing protein [Clostridia bacterium]